MDLNAERDEVKSLRICSNHFKNEDYANKRLKSDSVPSVKVPNKLPFPDDARSMETDTGTGNVRSLTHELLFRSFSQIRLVFG